MSYFRLVWRSIILSIDTGRYGRKMEFEILVRGLYRPEQVVITYDPVLRMPVDDAIQGWMDDLWQRKLAIAREKGVRLFDAPLFRLVKVETGVEWWGQEGRPQELQGVCDDAGAGVFPGARARGVEQCAGGVLGG